MLRRALAPVWLALIILSSPLSSALIHGQQAEHGRVIADGIAWYLQSRAVAEEFERTHRKPGYRFLTTCFFGCTVPWQFRSLIVNRWGDGLGRAEVLRHTSAREWPALDRRLPPGVDVGALRVAMLFGSLERELGWPTLQGALEVIAAARDGQSVIDLLEAATARQWDTAFASALQAQPSDVAVGQIMVDDRSCDAAPCVVTRVLLARTGDVPFPLELRIDFDDRSHLSMYWTGTPTELAFESASPPSRVRIDPDRHWLLDGDFANGDYRRSRSTNVAIVKWVGQWIVWLQEAMLTYSFAV